MTCPLRQRLLQDIAELQSNPYPNISLHVLENDITHACLVLTVERYGKMHMTVQFPASYPLQPPKIEMDSDVHHPNIFNSYICASILNTTEGYTPAYTLKGIAIQLLSFFSSNKIEQSGGGYSVNLTEYRQDQRYIRSRSHVCSKCQFGVGATVGSSAQPSSLADLLGADNLKTLENLDIASKSDTRSESSSTQNVIASPANTTVLSRNARRRKAKQIKSVVEPTVPVQVQEPQILIPVSSVSFNNIQRASLPDEILLRICDHIDTEDLFTFARSWDRIGLLMTAYDLIRTRELQCFCFKNGYMKTKLGVGVSIGGRSKIGFFESEFDLLSQEGFFVHSIRRSVQGVVFQNWLPLPISRGHWNTVKGGLSSTLLTLSQSANLGNVPSVQVIFHFMNDVVVKLNNAASEATTRESFYPYEETAKSSLTHASEKAIESYFHLFHLLLCLATSDPNIVEAANKSIRSFMNGKRSKSDCPNLGHLLVSALISDVEITEVVTKAIVRETITRNVVWMLDKKGAGMAELSYMEPSPVSDYRLKETFEASKTSYRLLMFLNLFRRTAVGSPRKPLHQLRDEAFDRHGAPPRGSAKGLADSIKKIHQIDNFPDFLSAMGVGRPSAAWFTNFLRTCVTDSHAKGYSKAAINQGEALMLRRLKEPTVKVTKGFVESLYPPDMTWKTFFPENARGGNDGRGGRGGRGGRSGGGRGRY